VREEDVRRLGVYRAEKVKFLNRSIAMQIFGIKNWRWQNWFLIFLSDSVAKGVDRGNL
jgi:hypothetical protein